MRVVGIIVKSNLCFGLMIFSMMLWGLSLSERSGCRAIVTVDSVLTINAEDLDGIDSFNVLPFIYLTDSSNESGKIYKLKMLTSKADFQSGVLSEVACQIKQRLPVGLYSLYVRTNRKSTTSVFWRIVQIKAPEILENSIAGKEVTASGMHFGIKPKIWLSYTDDKTGKIKKLKCKIEKPYKYSDARGRSGKSCMDLDASSSSVTFLLPAETPNTVLLTLHLKNRIEEATKILETQDQGLMNISTGNAIILLRENDGRSDFVILDVRTPEEFNAGYITNAVNLDFYDSNFSVQLDQLDKTKTYLVYCRSGNRSLSAATMMTDSGFSVVYNMLGGFNEFQDTAGSDDWITWP